MFSNFMVSFISFFINFISNNLLIIEIISFSISTILLALIIYFASQTEFFIDPVEHFFDTLGAINMSKRRTLKAWKQIQKRLGSNKMNDLKLAVLETDKVLDEVLRMAGFPGKNLDERLELITPAQIENIEEIKQAHKFKNRIATEPDLLITQNEAQISVDIYKKVFQDLNLID